MAGILSGKVAIVTGAGRGIGRAIAEEYALEGAKVVVSSRTASTVTEAVETIHKMGGDAIGMVCDVSELEQLRTVVAKTVETFGGIDILVNNAQSFGTRAKPLPSGRDFALEDLDEAEWDWVFETGVKATLRTMKLVFPHMKARGGGRIINFGSHRGVMCPPISASYNSNKEAIRALSRTAAKGWGQYGINVNVINPVIETDAARGIFEQHPEAREKVMQEIPLRYWGQPKDCARVAVYLAGPDSRYLTGMTFMVDGGLTTLP